MSQELGEPSGVQPTASLTWSRVWISALTQPSVATFESLVRDPNATSNRAYRWIFVSTLIGVLIQLALSYAQIQQARGPFFSSFAVGSLVITGVIIVALAVPAFAIGVAITNAIARALGGTGTYSQLAYAFAAYNAPLTLITFVIGSIVPSQPFNVVSLALGVYAIVLAVTAVKAVHRFQWGRALASMLIIPVGVIVVAVVVIVILDSIGTATGNIFSNIVSNV